MNIDMLLSVSQGHASTTGSASRTPGDSPNNGLFRQTLQLASQGQHRLLHEANPSALLTASSDALPSASFSSALDALGIQLDTEALEALMGYLSSAPASSVLSEAELSSSELVSLDVPLPSQGELQEIAQRLTLMTSYQTETATTPAPPVVEASIRSIAEQLSLEEHEVLPLLQSLNPVTSQLVMASNSTADIYQTLDAQAKQPLLSPTSVYANLTGDTANGLARSSFDAAPTNVIQNLAVPEGAQRSAPADPSLIAPNNAAPPVSASSTTPTQATLNAPVSSPSWPSQLGQQLVHITQLGGEQQVKMNLHPAELGPLSISLKMTEHGAQAHFLTAHAQVRQVLEQAIPQLREILAEQGIALTDASVGEQNTSGQAFSQQNPETGTQHGTSTQDVAAEVETNGMVTTTLDGRVDLYA